MKTLLITPPLLQPNTPYAATPILTAWLRSRGHNAVQADLSLELVALDLRIAVNAVGEIVGKTTTDDLLDSIFSQFCLGK